MQIVIPMSGFGERFRRAGYTIPKPLIEVEGKPIIAHVIDMFPGEEEFIFICSNEHLENPAYRMREILEYYCPSGRVVGIAPHKLGPVHAVRRVEHLLDESRPVVVNYCDFTCYWDWNHCKEYLLKSECDGAIPAYRGFHPHTLGTTNYAYMVEHLGVVKEIQEKQPFTDNRMEEYASSGTYYFRSARLMSEAFAKMLDRDLNVGGEYYVSLAYQPLLQSDYKILVYPLQHFMQWGTPEDLAEYEMWSDAFRRLNRLSVSATKRQGSVIVPMAGLGQRFVDEGFQQTKPLIDVSGASMVAQATRDLPAAEQYVFVLRSDMVGYEAIVQELQALYPGAIISTIDQVTEGQACTTLIGVRELQRVLESVPGPVTVGACDNGALYDQAAFWRLTEDSSIDVIVWGGRRYANAQRNPQMYGWINADGRVIESISVKKPLGDPASDPIVLGTFTFRYADDLIRAIEHLIASEDRVNGEFYLDSAVNNAIDLGMRCHLFEVDNYLCWGTPSDLLTFEYWQSCMHKWQGHPYRLENDSRVPEEQLSVLEERYSVFPLEELLAPI